MINQEVIHAGIAKDHYSNRIKILPNNIIVLKYDNIISRMYRHMQPRGTYLLNKPVVTIHQGKYGESVPYLINNGHMQILKLTKFA